MYPDKLDIKDNAKRLEIADAKAALIWKDAGLAYEFLKFLQVCHWHGKQHRQSIEDIKTITESYLSRGIDREALLIGGLMANLKFNRKPSELMKEYSSLLILLPPLDRLEEFRAQWQEEQREIEKAQEVEESRNLGKF
jgi:hypothetical protein